MNKICSFFLTMVLFLLMITCDSCEIPVTAVKMNNGYKHEFYNSSYKYWENRIILYYCETKCFPFGKTKGFSQNDISFLKKNNWRINSDNNEASIWTASIRDISTEYEKIKLRQICL